MADREVVVIIGSDVDQDRQAWGGSSERLRCESSWAGLENGMQIFNERMRVVKDSYGSMIRAVWFLRADEQIKAMLGEHAALFKKYRGLISHLLSQRDEIGWHIHLARWRDDIGWYAEIGDWNWMKNCIRKSLSAIPEELRPISVKSGWGFQNSGTISLLSELGLRMDFSCVPDAWEGNFSTEGLGEEVIDWRGAPLQPYRPDRSEPKREAAQGAALRIWEVPNAVFPLKRYYSILKMGRNLVPFRRGHLVPPALCYQRWGNAALGGDVRLFKRACDHAFKNAKQKGRWVLSAYFHPDSLLVGSGSGLYENRDNLVSNLHTIKKVSEREGIPFRYNTGRELLEQLEREG